MSADLAMKFQAHNMFVVLAGPTKCRKVALKAVHEIDKKALSHAKAKRLWEQRWDQFVIKAHEYRALVDAIKLKARAQERTFVEVLELRKKRGLLDLSQLEAESADIDKFIEELRVGDSAVRRQGPLKARTSSSTLR